MGDAPVLQITDRLRGKYTLAVNDGAGLLNGSNTFTRHFETPPIQHEAAELIEALVEAATRVIAAKEEIEAWIALGYPSRTLVPEPDRKKAEQAFASLRAAIAKAEAQPLSSPDTRSVKGG